MAKGYQEHDEPIPGYRLIERIGSGGFGEVWKATGPGDVEVALKVIDSMDRTKGGKELRGLQLLKKIRHPNLVPLIGYWIKDDKGNVISGSDSGGELPPRHEVTSRDTMVVSSTDIPRASPSQLIVAMGLCERSVYARFEECLASGLPGIPRDELLHYVEGAAKAIDFLNKHPSGAVQHCDVKPQNILLVGGEPQVCDFGLARSLGNLAQTSRAAATLAYGAPELFFGNGPSESTDQYSLAITYYEMLTGSLPFASEHRLYEDKRTGVLDFSQVSPAEQVVLKHATAVEPSERFGSVAEFMQAMRQAAASGVAPPTPTHRKRRASPRRKRRWPFVAAILLGLVGAAAVIVVDPRHSAYQSGKQIVTDWWRRLGTGDSSVRHPDELTGGGQGGGKRIPVGPKGSNKNRHSPVIESPDERRAQQFLDCLARHQFVEAAKLLPSFSEERRGDLREQLIAALHDWLPELVSESRRLMATGVDTALQDLDRNLGALEEVIAHNDLIAKDARERHWVPTLRLLVRGRVERRLDVADQALAEALAARKSSPPMLHGGVLLLQIVAEPRGDDNVLAVLDWFQELLDRRPEDGVAPLTQLDDWERAQLNAVESELLERLRAKIARGAVTDETLLERARKIWPDLELLLQLNEIERLILAEKLPEADEKLSPLSKIATSSESVRARLAQVVYRLQVAQGSGELAEAIQQLPGLLPGYADPHWFITKLFGRANSEGANAILEHVPPLVEAATKALAATPGTMERSLLEESVRKGVDECSWTLVLNPPKDVAGITAIASRVRQFFAGKPSPLLEVLRAELKLPTLEQSTAERQDLLRSMKEHSADLVGEQGHYATYVRVHLLALGNALEDRRETERIAYTLLGTADGPAPVTRSWCTATRQRHLVSVVIKCATRYFVGQRVPTDDDLPNLGDKVANAAEILKLVTSAQAMAQLDEESKRQLDVFFVIAFSAVNRANVTTTQVSDAIARTERLLMASAQLETSKQELLVRRLRGLLALDAWTTESTDEIGFRAVRDLAHVMRKFVPAEVVRAKRDEQHDPIWFHDIAQPVADKVLSSGDKKINWNDLDTRPDVAFLLGVYGRLAQRHADFTIDAERINRAFESAMHLAPSEPEYRIGWGRSLLDLPELDEDELMEKLGPFFENEPTLPQPGEYEAPTDAALRLIGLRGRFTLVKSYLDVDVDARKKLLEQAKRDFETALKEKEHDEFFGTYIEGLSMVHLDLAFLAPTPSCLDCEAAPKDTRPWHLAEATEFARNASDLKAEERRLPENAYNAWGNALEDQAYYLRRTDCFAEAIAKFDEAVNIVGAATRGKGRSQFHRGRCRFRYAQALPEGSFASPDRVNRNRLLNWPEVQSQLGLAELDLRAALNSLTTSDSRLRAEVHRWLAYVIVEQALVKSIVNAKPSEKPGTLAPDDPLLTDARDQLAKGAKVARSVRGSSVHWSDCLLDQAQLLSLKDRKAAVALCEEILSTPQQGDAPPPTTILAVCRFLTDRSAYRKVDPNEDLQVNARHQGYIGQCLKLLAEGKNVNVASLDLVRHQLTRLRMFETLKFAHFGVTTEKTKGDLRTQFLAWREQSLETLRACQPSPETRAAEAIMWDDYATFLVIEKRWRNEQKLPLPPTIKPGENYLEEIAKAYDQALGLTIHDLDPQLRDFLKDARKVGMSGQAMRLAFFQKQSRCLQEKYDEHLVNSQPLRDLTGAYADQAIEFRRDNKVKDLPLLSAIAFRAWQPLSESKERDAVNNPKAFAQRVEELRRVVQDANAHDLPAFAQEKLP